MLDIKFIRDNVDLVQRSANDKGYKVDIAALLRLDDERRDLQKQVDALRERRNVISAQMKGGRPDQELIDQGKQLKIELAEREGYLKATEEKIAAIMKNVPNITFDDVPLGGEDDSVEVKRWGEQ